MSTIQDKTPFFKACPMCNTQWESMASFLIDTSLSFNGYQVNFGVLDEGIFFFTHETETCGSTMGLKVRDFKSLYSETKHKENKSLSDECPLYCLDRNNVGRCNAQCENAFAREISQIIKDRHTTKSVLFTATVSHSNPLSAR